jgi:MFS family permease
MLFIAANVAMMCMYRQSNTTLSVYLRDVHSVSEQGLGILTSFNAALVILFQFPISRLTDRYRPLIVIAAGTVLFALGFSMYAWVSTYVLFMVATAIITVGEMFVAPTAQAVAAQLSPEDKRGRYMGVFGFSWTISTAIGPFLAGLIMDHADPRWVWYAVGLAGLMAAGGFALLQRRVERFTRCEEALGESDVTVERNVV